MKTNFKRWSWGIVLCLLPNILFAQEYLTGFYRGESNPSQQTRQIHVQTLPFYDDFSSSRLYPDSTLWRDRNAFVNSGFPVNMPTSNAATLDVLDPDGKVYDYCISNPFIAEHLSSTQIRLDSVFLPEPRAITPADSVYLSFCYQPQGNGLPPETNDSLVLEFGIPNDFDTTWHHIWSVPGQTLAQFLQENDSNYFKQVMIPITDPQYFIPDFFFRFYNYASIANSSQPTGRGNEDNWNIDMVYLDMDRSFDDASYPKICFTGQIPSFLKRYKAMPYKHYRANPYANLNDEYFQIQVSNLDNTAHTIRYGYSVEQVNGSQSYAYMPTEQFSIPAQSFNQSLESTVNQLFSIDYDRDSTSYIIRHYLIDANNPLMGDTVTYPQGFYNYFAYDDGTPEAGYGVSPASSAFAVKYEMAELDTIRGVQILFNHTLNDANNKYFDLVVWKDNNGKPGEEVYRLPNQRPKWSESLYEFVYYKFQERIRLSGSFYVGIVQRDNALINIGVDMTNDNAQYNFFNTTGSWQQSTLHGSIMIRPVVGAGYFIGVDENPIDEQVVVYPNPASDLLHIRGVENGQSIALYDMTGRKVLQSDFCTELPVSTLSNGIYFLQITTHKGIISKKISIQQ